LLLAIRHSGFWRIGGTAVVDHRGQHSALIALYPRRFAVLSIVPTVAIAEWPPTAVTADPGSSLSRFASDSSFGADSETPARAIVIVLLTCCGPCAMFARQANTGGFRETTNVSIVARHWACALNASRIYRSA
jgi:hypothetical protein